jgi:hypothetical protein
LAKKAADKKSYGTVEFQVVAQYAEGPSEPTLTVERFNCVIDGRKESHSEGNEILTDELSISYTKVLRNGLSLFDGTEGEPL